MPLGICSRSIDPEVTIVEFSGDLNASTMADDVEGNVGRLLAVASDRVVFDLSRLVSMDSAGIGLMIFCFSTVRDSGGSLALAAPTPRVMKVLKFTRLDSFLTICDRVDDAVELAAVQKPEHRVR
jgi:anti-sigma B factor antagonist